MAIPLHAPHGTPKKVVTFFTGWYKSDVADHGRQLRNQLIDALGSEVALVLSHFDKDVCASRRAACVRARFRGLEPISFISSERQLSIAELTLMLEALPIWPKVIGKLNRTCARNENGQPSICQFSCIRDPTWSATSSPPNISPYRCRGMSNTVLSPVLGDGLRANQRSNVLLEFHSQQRSYNALLRMEKDRGSAFETVVFSRLEYTWLRPHPPLEMLRARAVASCVWVPFGEDNSGINDRHAVMDRRAAAAYFGRLDMVLNSRKLLRTQLATSRSEVWLRDGLDLRQHRVCRFAGTCFLSCCSNVTAANCWTRKCWERIVFSGSPMLLRGKYPEELELALQHHVALGMNGSRYVIHSIENRSRLEDAGKKDTRRVAVEKSVGNVDDVWRPAWDGNTTAADGLAAVWQLGSRRLFPDQISIVGIAARRSALGEFTTAVRPVRQGTTRSAVSALIRWDLQER
jgi:hypothetical protein